MTQKELLYLEDAIGHEQNIVKLCKSFINNIQDNNLILFITEAINTHNQNITKITNLMEELQNE